MDLEIWEGELVVEGVPDYSEFLAAADFLRKKTTTWLKPLKYDANANLSHFYLLTDLKGYRSSPNDEASKLMGYISFVESLFEGAVELKKPELSIGAPCLSEMVANPGRSLAQAKDAPFENERKFLDALGAALEEPEKPELESALAELDGLIGLEPVKKQIHDIVSIVQNRGKDHLPCLHMAFNGNPGTGKTEVARILGRVFAGLGILPNGNFTEVDRSDLVAGFVGQTTLKTKEAIDGAMGGVLFIDEAYSLGMYKGGFGAGLYGGERHDFGPEAIDTLVKQMEDHRNDFICIMAGYPREMEVMMSANPGLKDRVGFTIDFPDYDDRELAQIFNKMIFDKGYELLPEASDAVAEACSIFARVDDQAFGNARFMRKLAERVILKQNVRSSGMVIEACDVSAALDDKDFADVTAGPTCTFVGFIAV